MHIKPLQKEKDPYEALKYLKDEYFDWVEKRMDHMNNPENNELLEMIENVDDYKASGLASFMARFPSKRAIEKYTKRINGKYLEHPHIAICLARMGDEQIYCWSKEQLNKRDDVSRDARELAIRAHPKINLDI